MYAYLPKYYALASMNRGGSNNSSVAKWLQWPASPPPLCPISSVIYTQYACTFADDEVLIT